MRAVACFLLLTALSGCVSSSPPTDASDCSEGVYHPYEQRCATEGAGGEICHVWIGDGVQRNDYLYCSAQTDGQATVAVQFHGSGTIQLNVVQDGEVAWTRTVGTGTHHLDASVAAGDARLTVGFAGATGPVDVGLWG